jgi:two-component system LytT family sensor kinase
MDGFLVHKSYKPIGCKKNHHIRTSAVKFVVIFFKAKKPMTVRTLVCLKKRESLFWILQASGWLLYFAANLQVLWIRGSLTTSSLVRYATATLSGFLVTSSLRSIYRKIKILKRSITSLSLLTLLSSLIGANVLIWMSNFLRYPYSGIQALTTNPTLLSYLHRVIWWFTPLLGWSALYLGIKFWQEWKIQKERTEQANALTRTAQLQMLSYRMNPHFLFNALNSIRALISENKTSARSMVTELSEYLRYSLLSRNYQNVPLKDEIESILHYFNIQKMRYENKLNFFFDIEPAVEDFPIASFLIHPLAENSIIHGLRTSPLPLEVRIKAEAHNGGLCIEVWNSGTWIEPADDKKESVIGKGLDNVRKRLSDLYPDKNVFEIEEKDGFVQARLVIKRTSGDKFQ